MNPHLIVIESCRNCPYLDGEYVECLHPLHLSGATNCAGAPPPTCPLRAAPTLLVLKDGA